MRCLTTLAATFILLGYLAAFGVHASPTASTPTFPQCGVISTIQGKDLKLHNAGNTTCQAMTLHGRQIDPKAWSIFDFCTCQFFYGSEMARPCSKDYLIDTYKGPSEGEFNGLRAAFYFCWNHEADTLKRPLWHGSPSPKPSEAYEAGY